MASALAELLVAHRREIESLVDLKGHALLRLETREDLVQGIHLRALGMAGRFEYQGEAAFRGWIVEVAQRFLADRRDYWNALRRRSGPLLRWTASGVAGESTTGTPISTATGPSTFAMRREELTLVARALGLLGPRDRDLVQWQSEGLPLLEQSRRLAQSPESVRRAGQRALERFRKTWRLLRQGASRQ